MAGAEPRLARGRRVAIALGTLVVCVAATAPVERGDAAWRARALDARDGTPRLEPIERAIRAYEQALVAAPRDLAVRWKLLRALHFAGAFAAPTEAEARGFYERALDVAEVGLDGLAERAGAGERLDTLDAAAVAARVDRAGLARGDVARLHFWAALHWGAWSRTVGLLSAVRQGVAGRLYRYTTLALELEPGYDEGGALRLLGRLHAELPRVPWLTSWVDRDAAVPLVTRAYEMAPENPGNRLLLALTLLDLEPDRRAEARALLDQVARLTPRPSMRIEDLAMRQAAREWLADARAEGT
jgi:tetratricopeptide (TPR) repeat protein